MGAPEKIVLGSRGSDLAQTQAQMVEQALRKAWPDLEIALKVIRTSGDEGGPAVVADRKAGRKGMFTREIEQQLLVRRIDLAVHSAKDLPSEAMKELEIGAVLPRGPVGDVLIARNGFSLTTLPPGAMVATGSIRRQRQLGLARPDLQVTDLRGNVPTRLRKLRENDGWSGIVLARAGVERLGLEMAMESLSLDDFVPAGGQGVIALQVRRDDARVRRLLAPIDDEPTRLCLHAEREFLRLLDGDCDSPVGVHARIIDGKLQLQAQVFEENVPAPRVGIVTGAVDQPEALAAELMGKLYGNEN